MIGTTTRRKVLTAAVAALGTAALADGTRPASAQTTPKTFVLVHGSWHGGWCWRRVADRLTAKGHYVVVPTLSGVGERSHLPPGPIDLSTQIDDVVGEIKWKDLDGIVLVGHSYGGAVITEAGDLPNVAGLVYIAAFAPDAGESLATIASKDPTPGGASLRRVRSRRCTPARSARRSAA